MRKTQAAALGIVLCFLVFFLKTRIERHFPKNDSLVNLDTVEASYHGSSLKKYSLGFDSAIAGLLWIQTLQQASHEKIDSNKVSWEFAQLDAQTTLDPHFWRAYSFGFNFLSVFRQDKLGAKIMIEKWMKRFPNDWRPFYHYGFHLAFELGDQKSAAPYVLKAAGMAGAPDWLSSLGIRLLSETAGLVKALQMSVELFSQVSSLEGKIRLAMRIRSIRYNLQRSAWEHVLSVYREKNHSEPPTTAALVPSLRAEARELASVLELSEVPEELRDVMSESFPFGYDSHKKAIVYLGPSEKGLGQTGVYTKGK